MAKLLMISGDTALAQGKKGAFYNTLEEFHKYWDRIDVITPKTDQKINNIFGNVYIHCSDKPKYLQPRFIKRKGIEIYEKEKFDIVTAHEYPPFYNGIGARMLWNKIKVPYVVELMHIPGYPKAADMKEEFYKLLTKLFIKLDTQKARAIRVINKKEVLEFLKQSGIKENKLIYIPAFYIDLETFRPMEVEKEYDLVFAARLEKNKGIKELLEAISIARKEKPDIKLLIIGSGSLKKKLVSFVKENNLDKNVHFSGWLKDAEDVARAYNSARAFISPSFNEGGPRVILEAMACELPILTTKVGLALDIIIDEENGIFVDWDSQKMANGILGLLENNQLMKKISSEGKELVGQFEKKEAIQNYAEKIKELI